MGDILNVKEVLELVKKAKVYETNGMTHIMLKNEHNIRNTILAVCMVDNGATISDIASQAGIGSCSGVSPC